MFTVVGNPDNRRVALFRAAARAEGQPDPHLVPWLDVVSGRPLAFEPGTLVRIDSPGEDAEVDRLLRGAATAAEPGRIVGLAAWHRGLRQALGRIAGAARDAGARLLQDPDEILTMFDKRACHRRLEAHGVPVPAALPSPGGYQELRAAMAARGWSRVFVKPAHGSSASGVVALRVAQGRVRATTSVERAGPYLYNSLRVRDYAAESDIRSIVDTLAADGLHVERWFPKAGLRGRVVDLRVVVIDGRPTHVVVRGSLGPMTNLHLGNQRGDLGAFRAAAGEAAYEAGLETCVRAARTLPGSLMVGVDLMFSPDFRRHAIAEVNAFGDLLPGLEVAGRDTYAEQIAAVLCRT